MKPQSPIIVIDQQEGIPWKFPNWPTVVEHLVTGDYSIKGLEHLISIERKELNDLLGCIGHGRDRFKRELQRMRAHRFRLLVVETDLATIEAGEWRSKLKPNHVLGALAAWQAQFELPVLLAGNARSAAAYVEKYLAQCVRTLRGELEAVAEAIEPAESAA